MVSDRNHLFYHLLSKKKKITASLDWTTIEQNVSNTIKTFSIYSPSLEEIFLEILESDNNRTIENIIFNQNKSKSKINPFSKQSQSRVTDLSDLSIASPTPTITSSTASLNSLTSKTNQYKGFTLYLRQVLALLMKRFCNFKADKKMILMTFVLPLILLTPLRSRPSTHTGHAAP